MSKDKKNDIFIKGYMIFVIFVLFFMYIILMFTLNEQESKNKQYQEYSEYGYIKVYRISENIDEGIRVYRNADNPSSICGFLEPGNVVMVVEETENDEETCYKLVNDDGYIFTSSDNMIEVTVLNPN